MSEPTHSSGTPPVLALLDRVAGLLDDLGDPQAWRLDDTQTTAAVDAAYRLATRFHALAIGLLGCWTSPFVTTVRSCGVTTERSVELVLRRVGRRRQADDVRDR